MSSPHAVGRGTGPAPRWPSASGPRRSSSAWPGHRRTRLPGLFAHHLVVQDGGIRPGQVPGLEERAPVDVAGPSSARSKLLNTRRPETWAPAARSCPSPPAVGWRAPGPSGHSGVLLLVGVLLAHLVVIGSAVRPGRRPRHRPTGSEPRPRCARHRAHTPPGRCSWARS